MGRSNHICVAYRKLNKVAAADLEPMTTAVDLFLRLGKSKYFPKIDLSAGIDRFQSLKQILRRLFSRHVIVSTIFQACHLG